MPHGPHYKIPTGCALSKLALKSFRRAVRAVREEHRKLDMPMVVERNGKICYIKPWLKSSKRKKPAARKVEAQPPRILTAKEARKMPMIKSLERTFKRIDKNLRAEHRKLGLPLVVWKNGRVCKIKP